MADNTSNPSGARFRQILDRMDEKDGSKASEADAPEIGEMVKADAPTTTAAPAARRGLQMSEGFKNFAILFSLIMNAILLLVLIGLGMYVFEIKRAIAGPLIGGLHDSFVQMDQAHIKTTIPVNTTIQVNDTIPVVFDLPLQTTTDVVLTRDTPIPNTRIILNGISVPVDITLPAGTPLNVNLNLTVPVNQTVPVKLNVPVNIPVGVDIPLEQTDLHAPFSNLQGLFAPYNDIVKQLPDSWTEAIGGQ
jgi:hypothetical protein